MRGPRVLLTLMLAAAVLVAGCRTEPAVTAGTVTVVASFYPLAEFARRVGGPRVTVRTLVPAGVEPHEYEPSPREMATLHDAGVIIYNGAGFEPWLDKVLPGSTGVLVNATAGIPLLMASTEGGHQTGTDPHVWLDPLLAQRMVAKIAAGLSRADPAGRAEYDAGAAAVIADLQTLHRKFSETLKGCREREFITTHAAFGYLAKRYSLEQIAISGLSPEADPSPRRLKELVQLARERGIRVIYTETLISPRTAQALAGELGARVEVLNPIEGLTGRELQQGKNYFTVMYENLTHLAAGLHCR